MSRLRTLLRSVRFRITVVAAVVAAVVLVVAAGLLLSVQRQQLEDNLDASLARRADVLEVSLGEVTDTVTSDVVVLANAAGDDAVVQIVRDGSVVAATANATGIEPIAPAPPGPADEYRTVDGLPVEDDEFRVVSRRIEEAGETYVIHVAENNDDQRELVGELRNAVGVVVPIAVVVLAALVWWLVGRTLRPVESIRREVAEMSADQLDRRVPQPGTGDEIDRLASTMNGLLARIDDSNRRQQRFVADASHELRSPLARMRTELEVEASAPDDRRRPAPEIYDSVIEEIDAMSALVDDLLVLARSDAGQSSAERRPLDLDDLVLDEVARARATSADVTIDLGGVSAALVAGDPGELRRVVRNLLDNAVRHADTAVTVALVEEPSDRWGRRALLTIADDGPGIDPGQASAIFDRFTRLDDARSRSAGGTGLGLAIARDIVERHGGTLRLFNDDLHGGATFVAFLPALEDD